VASNLLIGLLLIGLVWGRFPEFFRDPVRDLAVILTALPTLALLGTSGAGKGVKHAGERGYLVVANTAWNLTLLVMIYLSGHRLALLPGDGPLRIAGLVVLGAGGVVRSASMLQLGRRFSLHVALQEQHALRTTGLYARVRHPSYLGLLLIMLGLALVFESQLGIWAVIVSAFMMRGRMEREEKFLLEQFDDEYRDYMARTKRLIPGIY
jgi:protein-S-isoprenylcysteine O-methyltransferase Ste14